VYWSGNGGPLSDPKEWWSSTAIQSELEQRLQYAVSRYGHATSLFSWQLFNEWNDWPGFPANDLTLAVSLLVYQPMS